jgi:hypothetical protein
LGKARNFQSPKGTMEEKHRAFKPRHNYDHTKPKPPPILTNADEKRKEKKINLISC